MRGLVAGVALMLTWGCVCRGQAPIERKTPAEEPLQTLKLASRLVTLSVNAVDANGSPVGGLEQKDFRLLEDGKEQKISFFDRQSATPLSIVLALDGSESVLRNEKLEKQAAERFVKSVVRTAVGDAAQSSDELDLMEFADDVTEVVAFTSDRKRISDGFDHLKRGDATALYDCVYLASQQLGKTGQGGGRRRVLVLITDGGDTVHGVQYTQAVEQAQRAGVMIYSLIVIPIYADAGRNTGGEHALIQMSDDTGGKYFYVEDAKDLGPALQKVSDDLRTQYVLGYYAPDTTSKNRPDGFRALKVELTNPDLTARITLRYRSGYYAGK
jgi:Ca-activated chloride channel family protein